MYIILALQQRVWKQRSPTRQEMPCKSGFIHDMNHVHQSPRSVTFTAISPVRWHRFPLHLLKKFFLFQVICLFSDSKFSLKVVSPSDYLSCVHPAPEPSFYFLTSIPFNVSIVIFQSRIFQFNNLMGQPLVLCSAQSQVLSGRWEFAVFE